AGSPRNDAIDVTHALTNDKFERAYVVPSIPFRAHTDSANATRETGEPGDCFPTGGTAWYRYTALDGGGLFSNTFGTANPTALGVYEGSELASLRLVGCDKNARGNSQVGFRATAGHTYWFQLTSTLRG